MKSYIHHIETAVPEYSYSQDHLSERMQQELAVTEKERRILRHIYSKSGITTRHSVLPDFAAGTPSAMFRKGQEPGTGERNRIYQTEATKLFVQVARQLLSNSAFEPDEITHLITVSCTGFFAPGPDFEILRAVGLRKNVRRYHLGFMGCYASVPALQMADTFAKNDPDAVILIVSAELCTIHFQNRTETDDLLSASVFGDGAAGAIVSSNRQKPYLYGVRGFHSEVLDKGETDMAWTIGNHGFEMVLTTYIPGLIREQLPAFLKPALDRFGLSSLDDVGAWAVHPGGRAILDKVEDSLKLDEHALSTSRDVLSAYGNMSSATILFVLKAMADGVLGDGSQVEMGNAIGDGVSNKGANESQVGGFLADGTSVSKTVLAMAFGPGLTLESALLELEPSSDPRS